MSRVVDQVDEGLLYEPDLFLQGLVLVCGIVCIMSTGVCCQL